MRKGDWLLGALLCVLVGLGAFFTAELFIEAYSPGMTRGRKREIVGSLLPAAIPLLTSLAALGLSLAVLRRGSLQSALRGGDAGRDGILGRALRIVTIATILALATPLLRALVGVRGDLVPSRLFETTGRTVLGTLGLLSAAVQEDIVLRWIPMELVLLAGLSFCARESRTPALVAVGLSTALAAGAHALDGLTLPSTEAVLLHGVPKAPIALVFACVYLRRGIVEAWITHAATNLVLLLVLPTLVALPIRPVTP